MKYILTLLFIFVLAVPSYATDEITTEELAPMVIEKTSEEVPVVVNEDPEKIIKEQAILICQSSSIMNEVVSAEYQPGVDAYGEAVVPADGGGEPVFSLPERVDIPIQVDILKTLGVDFGHGLDLEPDLGTLTMLKDGRILYNDKDISKKVHDYCREHKEDVKEEIE